MSDPRLIVPGQPTPPGPEQVTVSHTETIVGPDGMLYRMEVTGTADLTRGPLGRFVDLADQIRAEGQAVPSEIQDAIDRCCGA